MDTAASRWRRAALSALFLWSLDVAAQALPPEFQVNTSTTNHQFDSTVALISDSGFVVAWHDAASATAKVQRFTATAAKVGDELTASGEPGTLAFANFVGPWVSGLLNGGWVVVWSGTEDDVADPASTTGVAAQIFDGNGVKLGSVLHVNTTTAGQQKVGGVSPLPDGGFVVTWESIPAAGAIGQDGSGRGIYARRFHADGSSASGEFRVNTATADDQKEPHISPLASGGFVIVWMDNGTAAFKAQRFAPNGNLVGGEIIISGSVFNSSVAGLKNGGFVAAYTAAGGGVGTESWARQFDVNGAPVTPEFSANTYSAGAQQASGVAGLANGGYVVVWASDQQDGSQLGVYGQQFTAAGVKDGAEFRVNVKTDNAQTFASVSALGNGYVVTWSSNAQDGSEYGVFGRLFGDTGTGSGGNVIVGTPGPDNLTGTLGNDTINGKGDADIMTGLAGNDVYIVDNAGDQVVEAANEGTDVVKSSVTYTLPVNVETLQLTGAAAINAIGNALRNKLIGNDANNVLNGKAGADTMYGRGGNDTYYVETTGDRVVELADSGIDTVRSSVNFKLPSGVENLVLTGTAVTGTGNKLANKIKGNAVNNVLNGGPGNDTLTGGPGQDRFVFNSALSAASNYDRVTDFNVAQDQIRLEDAIFTALPATGRLRAVNFRVGSVASTAAHRIIYNATTGVVYYDADGTGPIAAIRFVRLPAGLALTNTSFVVQ